MWKKLKSYFSMNKWQSRALLAIGFLSLLVVGINYSLPFLITKNNNTSEKDAALLQQLTAQLAQDTSTQTYHTKPAEALAVIKGFLFNPNTASKQQLEKLGLRQKTIESIIKFQTNNWQFKTKADVKKLYTLEPEEFDQLEKFIDLPATKPGFTKTEFSKTNYKPISVEINIADTIAFEKLKGIGPALARRIVEYRTKLGGFYSIAQLGEVFGVEDSVLQKCKAQLQINKNKIVPIKINEVLFQTLQTHPYANNGLAFMLLQFRRKNGSFKNIEQLKSIEGINTKQLEKLAPYLVY